MLLRLKHIDRRHQTVVDQLGHCQNWENQIRKPPPPETSGTTCLLAELASTDP